jgi:hypothetical protein
MELRSGIATRCILFCKEATLIWLRLWHDLAEKDRVNSHENCCCKLMAPADHIRMGCDLHLDLDADGVIYPMTLSQAPI